MADLQQLGLRRLERGSADSQDHDLSGGILVEEKAKGRIGQMTPVKAFT